MKKTIITLILVCLSWGLPAQDTLPWSLRQQEDLLFRYEELIDEDESNQEELEELMMEEQEKFQSKEKVNLNALTAEEALDYLKLSDYQYYNLMSYLAEYGPMVSVYELNAVEGFSSEDMRRLQAMLVVEAVKGKSGFFRNFFRKSKSMFLLRYGQVLEKQQGYDKSQTKHYLGSPFRMAFKYQFSTQDKFVLAISGEKDAGEQFFKGAQKYGFDFYSAYLCLKNIGVLKKLVIGDFKLDFGQGLVMGSAMMGGRGGGVETLRHFAGMVKPVAPLNEGTALRGIAATVGDFHYTGTLFAAYRNYDGNVVTEDSSRIFEGSLSHSGYHRTEAEQEKNDNLRSWVFGGDFLYRGRVFRIGSRALYTLFNAKVLPTGRVYQQYNFTGKGLFNASVDYQLIVKKAVLYGEAAVSGNGGWAFVQAVNFELSPGASFALQGHYRDKRYVALQGASSGSAQGEWGFYMVSQMVLSPKLNLNAYYDYTYYPWLRYRVDAPSGTMQAGLNLTLAINRYAKLLLRYQYKLKQKNKSEKVQVNDIYPFHVSKVRLVWECNPVEFLALKTEVDYLYNHAKIPDYKHDGFLLYQDVDINVKKIGMGINMRIAFFDTDTYEERLYAYEHDVYYSFTVNSYYDKGWRAYLLIKYGYKNLHFWLRIAQTYYLQKEEIGSGLDLIEKKHKTELKLQIMLKW